MSSYDFIIDSIRFSYSSTSSFETCAYGFKLAYIDKCSRENNFYAQYGNLMHDCMEKYFSGKLDAFELSPYYLEQFDIAITEPDYGLSAGYKQQGKDFFDNFSFNRDDYEALIIEDSIKFKLGGVDIVTKPDLVLRNKSNNIVTLYDYKTAKPFYVPKGTDKEKWDNKKMNGYYNQVYLYAYSLRTEKNIAIDEICIWFVRMNRTVTIPWELEKEKEAVKRVEDIIIKIKDEEEFPYNNSNKYFCENLCGVRKHCEYR